MQPDVEAVLCEGLRRVAVADEAGVSAFHRVGAFDEMWNLRSGQDCCYDRPGTGFAYASWYHPRRVHHLVRRLLPMLGELGDGQIVVDLGAGTGATAWALALAGIGAVDTGGEAPLGLRVLAVESSPSMATAGECLWAALLDRWPPISELVQLEWIASPWLDPPEGVDGCWLVAGHLFDASDSHDEVRRQFRRVLLKTQPARALLDAPQQKWQHLAAAIEGGVEAGWTDTPPRDLAPQVWRGELRPIGALRRESLGSIGADPSRLARDPRWDGGPGVVEGDLVGGAPAGDRLFAFGPGGLALDDDQDRLSAPRDRLTLLVGAAGSGKSVVLVERIARTATAPGSAANPPHILVTTRNRLMIEQLRRWLVDRLVTGGLDPEMHCRAEGDWTLRWGPDAAATVVRLLNWDKVPTQLFGMSSTGSTDLDAVEVRRRRRERQGWEPLSRYPQYFGDADWLTAELRRVIHGLRIRTLEAYLRAPRTGRRVQLQQQIREVVWEFLMTGGQTSFTYLWMDLVDKFVEELESGDPIVASKLERPFTHVYADEVQDFGHVDLEFMAALVTDPRRMFCVGDAGQAMLLSSTFDFPGYIRGRRRDVEVLTRSYRLSRRIAEAVRPLATAIAEQSPQDRRDWIGVPDGTRSGVLGVRPIVVVADGNECETLLQLVETFSPMLNGPGTTVVLAEGRSDDPLLGLLAGALPNAVVRAETMAKIKGLERTMVVWQTNRRWKLDESAMEFVHTVLTRATSLAVLVVEPETTDPDIATALGRLRPDRILHWTPAAAEAWERFVGGADDEG